MKKILALILALTMVFAFAACSGGGSDQGGGSSQSEQPTEPVKTKVADDKTVDGMSFTPPAGFTQVKRMLDKTADGTLTEKTLEYTYDDDTSLSFVSNSVQTLDKLLETGGDKFKDLEVNGKAYHVYESGSSIYVVGEINGKIYGLDFEHASDNTDKTMYNEALNSIKYEETNTISDNGDEEVIGDITYTLDPSLNIVSKLSSLTETTEGDLVKKDITYRFGKDADNPDIRFVLRVAKNTTVDNELNSSTTYEDATLLELPCKVRKDPDDGSIIEYFVQKDADVYIIKNIGISNGWSTTRSDESKTAFDALVKSLAFK